MSRIKVDLDIRNFKEELARIEREIKEIANKDITSKINYATDTLRVVTPVDTGEAREGWDNEISKDLKGNVEGVILNPVEHITYLNQGSSKQAPKYFIEQVLLKIGILTPD